VCLCLLNRINPIENKRGISLLIVNEKLKNKRIKEIKFFLKFNFTIYSPSPELNCRQKGRRIYAKTSTKMEPKSCHKALGAKANNNTLRETCQDSKCLQMEGFTLSRNQTLRSWEGDFAKSLSLILEMETLYLRGEGESFAFRD